MNGNILKMRSAVIILFCALLTSSAFAQKKKADFGPDSADCVANLSVYYEFYKQKNYVDAYKPWQKALELCPASRKSLYQYGSTIMQHRIKRELDPAVKESLEDSLYLLYDMRIEHFGSRCFVLGQKAAKMYKYDKDQPDLAFAVYKESVDCLKEKSSAGTLSGYYQALNDMFKMDPQLKEQLINDYLKIAGYIDHNIDKLKMDTANGGDPEGKKAKRLEGYIMAKSNVNEIFYKVADCEALNSVLFKILDAAEPDDLEIRKKALNILNKKDCSESDMYLELAKTICEIEPDHGCKYSIGIQHLKKKEYIAAYKNFKGAVELCSDCEDKDKYLLRAGQAAMLSGQHQTAYGYAQKMLARNSKNGEAYLLMGDAYLGSVKTCEEGSDLRKWGVYWVASDIYEQARAMDPSVAAKAGKKLGACKAHYPTKGDLFNYSMKAGDAHAVECWINKGTKARQQD